MRSETLVGVEGGWAAPRLDMEEIARAYYAPVFRFCSRRVGADRAADAAQETFVTAQRALPKYRGDSALSTWLFGIAHNECRRIARRMRAEPCALTVDVPAPAREGESNWVDRQALGEALKSLSPEHREVVFLHELEGLTYDEIGQILGIPTGTVKSRLHHAFANLRRTLDREGALAR